MNIDVIFNSAAAGIYLVLSILVYFKSRSNPINRSFAIWLLCVAVWNIDIVGIRLAPNPEFADLWGKIFRTGLLFIPPTMLHFITLFTTPVGLSSKYRKTLVAFYIVSIFFSIINWTPYFTGGIKETKWGFQVIGGPLYPLFFLQFLISVLFGVFFLVRGLRVADSYQRHRLKYFFLAMSISLILGGFGFLPVFGFEIFPFTGLAVSIGLVIAAYSVAQHRLMDVSLFMARGISYVFSILIFGAPAALALALIEKAFFQQFSGSFTIIVLTIGIVAVTLFGGVKERIDRKMQRIIVRDKFLYHRTLEDFSRRLVTIVELNRLLSMLGQTIERSMGIQRILVFLYNPEKDNFRAALVRNSPGSLSPDAVLPKDFALLKFMEEKKEPIVRGELIGLQKRESLEGVLKALDQLGAEVCLPLIYLDRIIGFICLGHKEAEVMYYREDLALLGSLANQVAMAIENANLYENLKKSQMIMRRADRLASLGTLIAGLAHEIRNPLVSIKTFTQLLPERMDDEEFRNYFLTVASGEIDRLTTLINELLGFAKPTEPNLKGENVNSIIDKMEFLISTEAKKKNIVITKNYSPNLPPVMADAEQIKQVLLNILLNGMQAIEGEKGQVWIETRVARVARESGIEPFVQIEIRDNGVGISKENLDHIFDPFFTTRPEGSGLGLAITYQIVHEHGGFIDVESEIGKGTSFRVNFPLKAGENGNVSS